MLKNPSAVRCAIYTRKSTEEGLEQEFNSLHAQREAAEAYIQSQKHLGWTLVSDHYDDGGFTGSNLERPALQRLLQDIDVHRVDCILVYKVDRLSRSLLDFARLVDRFDQHAVSFVSVTQQFNTTSSLGRLTLNILLSFAQFEREIIGERTRDKMSAARRKGKWTGGTPVLGYDVDPAGGRLIVNEKESRRVREIFALYIQHHSLAVVVAELARRRWKTKSRTSQEGREHIGRLFTKASLRLLLINAIYDGKVEHRGAMYAGEHAPIIDPVVWREVNAELRGRPARRGRSHSSAPERPTCRFAGLQELPTAHDSHIHGQEGAEVSILRLPDGSKERMEFVSHQIGSGRNDGRLDRGAVANRFTYRRDSRAAPCFGS